MSRLGFVIFALAVNTAVGAQGGLPEGPLTLRAFRLQFNPAGTFSRIVVPVPT